jgi:hypothetical protein
VTTQLPSITLCLSWSSITRGYLQVHLKMDPIQLHIALLLLRDLIKEAMGDTGSGSNSRDFVFVALVEYRAAERRGHASSPGKPQRVHYSPEDGFL